MTFRYKLGKVDADMRRPYDSKNDTVELFLSKYPATMADPRDGQRHRGGGGRAVSNSQHAVADA